MSTFFRGCSPIIAAVALVGLYTQNASAQLLGWSEVEAPYVSMVIQSTQDLQSLEGESQRMTYMWQEIFLDIHNNRALQNLIASQDRPSNFRQPEVVLSLIGTEITTIQHESRQALISINNTSNLSSNSIIFAGRTHKGKVLSDVIAAATDQFYLETTDQTLFAQLSAPYFSQQLTLAVDTNGYPIGIEQGNNVHVFAWVVDEVSGEPYVIRSESEYTTDSNIIRVIETVVEFKTYDSLPDSLFLPVIPKDYSIRDMRELLRAPAGL